MSGSTSGGRLVANPLLSAACLLFFLFLLPQYGGVAVMVASALLLSACVAYQPDSFRSRSGSLRMAHGLVTAMWIAVAGVALLTLTGQIQG